MSMREGTRRKKISVLHMLGTWEGKIDGCNCPSCKEFDEEQVQNKISKLASKVVKGSKPSPKKPIVKVKTTKVIVDKGTGELISKKVFPKKFGLYKSTLPSASDHEDLKSSDEVLQDTKSDSAPSDKEPLVAVTKGGIHNYILETMRTSQVTILNTKDLQNQQKIKVNKITGSKVLVKETRLIKQEHIEEQRNSRPYLQESNSSQVHNNETSGKVLSSPGRKTVSKVDMSSGGSYERIDIKQEPLDFLSDEDVFEEIGSERNSGDWSKLVSKGNKRARMVTSEVDNIYAKPRMVFTGTGVVKKFEPGVDKTPKSKRGRKPNRNITFVSVKEEPKELELKEEHELDQLQQAFSEAADDLDEDELLDALDDFEEEPEDVKASKKKAKFRVVKRVDADGDKYLECNMCFKMLKESSIKQHYKTHTGEKPHGCDECPARFTRKGDVERHKRLVHKNQRPFKCRKCKRTFSDRKNLKVHLQNHDKAIYYACNTCGFKFGKREYYENHIRYIHPLPDGSMPIFGEMEQDLAMEQLMEIEGEEKKEKEDKGLNNSELVKPTLVKREIESVENEAEEEEAATEITVTDGLGENAIPSSNDQKDDLEDSDNSNKALDPVEMEEKEELTDRKPAPVDKPQISTDVRVSKGTLSFIQMVSDVDSQDEDLVSKAIATAISQAANTIESLQTLTGANLSGNEVDFEDDDEDDDELLDEDDEDDEQAFQEILGSNYDMLPVSQEQKSGDQPAEIHISAVVGGVKKKFIIQVPSGSNLNIQSTEGMEMIVSMVNQLCAGKGELDGPIEVVMHNPSTKAVSLE